MRLLLALLVVTFVLAVVTADRPAATPRPIVLLVACVIVGGGFMARRFI